MLPLENNNRESKYWELFLEHEIAGKMMNENFMKLKLF